MILPHGFPRLCFAERPPKIGFSMLVDVIASRLTDLPQDATRKRALVIMSTRIGALTMARVAADPDLSLVILQLPEKHLKDLIPAK